MVAMPHGVAHGIGPVPHLGGDAATRGWAMRGEVLHYDEDQGFGFITGADGNRYTFTRENLRRQTAMAKGTTVEFQPGGGQARDVFSIAAQAASPAAGTIPAPAQAGPAPATVASPA